MEKQKKSHKYLAESILNRFSYKDNAKRNIIDYVDTRTFEIRSDSTRRFNRELGYYTNINEDNLKTNSEEKIGNVIKKLEMHRLHNKMDFILSKSDKDAITKYLAYQWLRSDYFNNLIKERLKIDISLKDLKNIFIAYEQYTKLVTKHTENMGLIIRFNNTEKQYIINSSASVINKNSKNYYAVTVILSPYISVTYCKKDSLQEALNTKSDFNVQTINDELIIRDENLRTFCATLKVSPFFVVGRKEELEETISIYNKINKK